MNKTKELIFFPSWVAGRQGYAERVKQVFLQYLKEKDLLATPQRLTILDFILKSDTHLSQDDIYLALRKQGIGKVTVFRTLKMLEECNLLEKVTDSQDKIRYEIKLDRPHHDHLVCLDCGRITEIQWPEIEKLQEKLSKSIGFTTLYHRHELFGRCQECKKRTTS